MKKNVYASEPWFPSYSDSFTLFAAITHKCNQKCLHCFAANELSEHNFQSDLSDEEWISIINQLSELEHPRLFFTGGEPLMHPSLTKFISYAYNKAIPIILGTNATLITSEVSDSLYDAGLREARVSLDGANFITHDSLRGEGSFDKTMTGISELIRNGIHVSIRTTINKLNYHEMNNIADLIVRMGISDWELKYIIPIGRALSHPELLTTSAERTIALDAILKIINVKYPALKIKLMEGTLQQNSVIPEGIKVASCPAGTRMVVIQPTGEATPCGYLTAHKLGNIGITSLNEIRENWKNIKKKDKQFSLPNGCKNCKHQYICKGGCPAYNFCNEDI